MEQLQIIAAETAPRETPRTLTNAERQKFESERSKLYLQLDEKVGRENPLRSNNKSCQLVQFSGRGNKPEELSYDFI